MVLYLYKENKKVIKSITSETLQSYGESLTLRTHTFSLILSLIVSQCVRWELYRRILS